MPEGVDALEFPALQTYDSGEVVRWIEPTPPGGEEPEHPAPAVAFAAATDDAAAEAAARRCGATTVTVTARRWR